MKNLMNRDEYLQNLEEGFIKDTIKKGWDRVKNFFSIGMKKIKDFIAIFDNSGNILPALSPQAIADHFSNSHIVRVFVSKALNDSVVEAGGNTCDENPTYEDTGEMYDYGPTGKDFFKWVKDEKYKDDVEYQNFLAIPGIIKECYKGSDEEGHTVNESWEGVAKARSGYVDKKELRGIHKIDVVKFEDVLNRLINDWSVNKGKTKIRVEDGKVGEPLGNVLVFGAPGIGKSTVPSMVVRKYNESVGGDTSKMISLISINCANLDEGDFMMPTMPKEINITREISKFSKAFPQASSALDELDDEQREEIANTIHHSGQFKATDAPKSWLPSYRETGDSFIDTLLNDAANGGVYRDTDGNTKKVGGGGIILFDEFLRCKPGVFGQLMTFLLERKLNGWVLGDKWAIIACSNRPCDDDEVNERWGDWSPAARDRFARFYQLVPDPEGWKKWARKKGCDELILDFIFEKDSMTADGEYPRWHSSVNHGEGDSYQVKPVTPRAWEKAFTSIGSFEIDENLSDISEMKIEDIEDVLSGSFDDEFISEFTVWLRDHLDTIDLDAIMRDPKEVYLPKKFVNDPAKALVLIQNLISEFKSRFKENPDECSDEQLANICAWLGMNYRNDLVAVQNFVEELVKDIFKDGTKYRFSKYIKTNQILLAAYPMRGIEDEITNNENDKEENYPWPEGSLEIVKGLMKKYFPWRIDGDTIKYYDDLNIGED